MSVQQKDFMAQKRLKRVKIKLAFLASTIYSIGNNKQSERGCGMPEIRLITETSSSPNYWIGDEEVGTTIGVKDCPLKNAFDLAAFGIEELNCIEYSWTPDDGPGLGNGCEGVTCKCYAGMVKLDEGLAIICTQED